MKQSISNQIENMFPSIQIVTLDIIGETQTNSINIKFSYRILKSNEDDAVMLTIQNM